VVQSKQTTERVLCQAIWGPRWPFLLRAEAMIGPLWGDACPANTIAGNGAILAGDLRLGFALWRWRPVQGHLRVSEPGGSALVVPGKETGQTADTQ
jgi:hypothetical protein